MSDPKHRLVFKLQADYDAETGEAPVVKGCAIQRIDDPEIVGPMEI